MTTMEYLSCLFSLSLLCLTLPPAALSATRRFEFKIQYTNVTRLCNTKSLVSVNGQFPGPTNYVVEGDTVIVNVTNLVSYNATIHWHGVRQFLSAWADGPSYITQCPIQSGKSYVHRFRIIDQRGTLFWHAHISWLRATLHGGFIILPSPALSPPFLVPSQEFVMILGEWWNANVEDIIAEALVEGGGYQISDALTINGQPGFLYSCSQQGTQIFHVMKGQSYMLRIINAAVNFQLYVAITGHSMRIVEVDAVYTEPYEVDILLVAPGQTTTVILHANQSLGNYAIAASVYSPGPVQNIPFPQTPTTAVLSYNGAPTISFSNLTLPIFPAYNDTIFALNFLQKINCQPFSKGFFYYDVPRKIDKHMLFTFGYAVKSCPAGRTCEGPGGDKLAASVSNITFSDPNISILQAYYNHIAGVYESNFPNQPLYKYDYTKVDPADKFSVIATKVKVLKFNMSVQIVFQNTATLTFESHPIHLHGQNFYIVGSGNGAYNARKDSAKFNLINPVARNTVAVPSGGWAAVRFKAMNPGVWYLHCHFDIHNSWGMSMAFLVKNGKGVNEILPPPPKDLPPC